jgi:predicted transcriptional regulator
MSVEKDTRELTKKIGKKTLSQQFDAIENEFRTEPPKKRRQANPYRQPMQVVHDALLKCRKPTRRYEILKAYNTDRAINILKELIKNGLIMPTDVEAEWVITKRGEKLLGELDGFLEEYPFLIKSGITHRDYYPID